jgi:hypothetical protein
LSESPKILKTVDARVVAVAPDWLQGVTADGLKSGEKKTVVGITDPALAGADDVSEDIRLAPASSAWARSAEELQVEIRLGPVIPADGQFAADLLDVRRFQAHADFKFTTTLTLRAIPEP